MSIKPHLPPLDALVAFEAAARLLSFTAAAHEQNLSQAAISQQIRNLEDRLGVKLFKRAHRAVTLTSAGREYQHTVSPILKTLVSATTDIRYTQTRPKLIVAADQAASAMLIVPELHEFLRHHPEISLRMISTDIEADCLVPEVQIAVLHGDGNWPGFDAHLLFTEKVYPVCSPEYARSAPAISSPSDLVAHTLLNLDDDHWDWMNWRVWLSGNRVEMPVQTRKFEINNYQLLIDAARNGQGLALGWDQLVAQDLTNGTLIRPLNDSLTTSLGYYQIWRNSQDKTPEAEAFIRWMSSRFQNQLDVD